jgi:Xaa-Pro aminopeptidase/Xaa-Pro dipeptidase
MAIDPARHSRTSAALAANSFDAILCSSPTEILLVTGYWPVMGSSLAVFTADGRVSVLVPEDEEDLAEKTSAAHILTYKPAGMDSLDSPSDRMQKPLAGMLEGMKLSRARLGLQLTQGMQPATYAVSNHYRTSVSDMVRQLLPDAQIDACDDLLEAMKAVKTAKELDSMRQACCVAAAGFAAVRDAIRPGAKETDVAAAAHAAFSTAPEAERLHRSYGYFFCMSGPNSAKAAAAYARTRQRVLQQGDLVMVHANTCADGYWTDLTRTYTVGEPGERPQQMRAAIGEARSAALASIRPGVTGAQVDGAARSVMTAHGFGEAFKHSTGHGVGFAAANPNGRPRIHPLSPDVLEQGMTFNVEPAAYFDGYGGMRHCDVVAVTADGVEVLSNF